MILSKKQDDNHLIHYNIKEYNYKHMKQETYFNILKNKKMKKYKIQNKK